MQLDKLSAQAVESLTDCFTDLPSTDHIDGQYRLRRYSKVRMNRETMVYDLMEGDTFTQSSKYNKFQGDIPRRFESIDDKTLKSYGVWELCGRLLDSFRFQIDQLIEIHQMRVVSLDGTLTPVSPEGVHQDGYDAICIACLGRHNVSGGHILLYKEEKGTPICDFPLDIGEIAFINDRDMWHNASPIAPVDPTLEAHADFFILTAKN
jgi:hypothetical protein